MAAPRQRKKGRQAVRNKQGGFPGWGWGVIGIVGGGLLAMWFTSHHGTPGPVIAMAPHANPDATAPASSEAAVASTAPAPPKKPQYDFYSVLPEKDIRIPDAELSAKVRAEQQQAAAPAAAPPTANTTTASTATPVAAAPTPASHPAPAIQAAPSQTVTAAPPSAPAAAGGENYLLQIGAFPNSDDAEALKAKLAFQGFVANVQKVTINGQTYNRVRLGPFHSATQLESTKQRLTAAGIHAIALKEGK